MSRAPRPESPSQHRRHDRTGRRDADQHGRSARRHAERGPVELAGRRRPVRCVARDLQLDDERQPVRGQRERERERARRAGRLARMVDERRVPERLHPARARGRLSFRHVHHDHHRRRQRARHHRHRDGALAKGHTELVHRLARGRRLPARAHHHAVLAGQRDDGLLGVRPVVVRRALGGRRAPVHVEHHEPLPHQPRPLLVHHARHRVPAQADARARRHHDRHRVDPQRAHLDTAAPRLEEGDAAGRVSEVRGEFAFHRISSPDRFPSLFPQTL